MSLYLGIDTSNYTTSLAVYDSVGGEIFQNRRLLPVKEGNVGLRQSDAVFHHVINFPELAEELFANIPGGEITAIAASDKPRNISGSYMPCFNVGCMAARSLGAVLKRPVNFFSHQAGHIAAAIYSSKKLDLLDAKFIAFHVSGGTTEAVMVTPDSENAFRCEILASSLDLKAGQAIDRTGVMLGLDFPAGAALESLALTSGARFNIHPSMKGCNCSLSGIENKCRKMFSEGEPKENIALFCLEYIKISLFEMALRLQKEYGELPLLFAGGVMSNVVIRDYFEKNLGAFFAEPSFSSDNAAGTALLSAYVMGDKRWRFKK